MQNVTTTTHERSRAPWWFCWQTTTNVTTCAPLCYVMVDIAHWHHNTTTTKQHTQREHNNREPPSRRASCVKPWHNLYGLKLADLSHYVTQCFHGTANSFIIESPIGRSIYLDCQWQSDERIDIGNWIDTFSKIFPSAHCLPIVCQDRPEANSKRYIFR